MLKAIGLKQSETKKLATALRHAESPRKAAEIIDRYVDSQTAQRKTQGLGQRVYEAVAHSNNAFADTAWLERQRVAQGPVPASPGSPSNTGALSNNGASNSGNGSGSTSHAHRAPPKTATGLTDLLSSLNLDEADPQMRDLVHHMRASGMDDALIKEVADVGFDTIQSALEGNDQLFLVDVGGGTAGGTRGRMERAVTGLTGASLAFDDDGVDLYGMSENHYEPATNLTCAAEVQRALAAMKPSGGTPMATPLRGILQGYIDRLVANEQLPDDQKEDIKKLSVILIGRGTPTADYELKVGEARYDGVYINGERAPENAFVAGKARFKQGRLVDNQVVNEGYERLPGIPVNDNQSIGTVPVVKHDAQGPFLDQESTRSGQVLVRIPHTLEEVIVEAATRLKAEGFGPTQLGIMLFRIDNEPGTDELFNHLDDNLKAQHGVFDIVDYVSMPADGKFTAAHLIKGVAAARNRKLDKQKLPTGNA